MCMSRAKNERLTKQTRIQSNIQAIFNTHTPAGGNRKNSY